MPAAAAAETVTVGLVGAVSATHWPVYIGLKNGYYAAEDLKLDMVFIQSSAALVQQLTAGSLDIALSTGLADPIRAIDKGGAISIVRIEMQAPPYALIAKPAIKRWSDLKGKTISIGGPKDITRIYLERMAVPNGVKPGDYDTVFAGATSARFSALTGGAVDAADPAAAVQLLCGVGGLHQSRPDHRLRPRTAVRRRGGQPRLGGEEQGPARQGAQGAQHEHGVVLRSARTATRRSS